MDIQAPPISAALLKRLGGVPFWRSDRRFVEAFEQMYARASLQATHVLVGAAFSEGKKRATEAGYPAEGDCDG